jgi:hypothetical protein
MTFVEAFLEESALPRNRLRSIVIPSSAWSFGRERNNDELKARQSCLIQKVFIFAFHMCSFPLNYHHISRELKSLHSLGIDCDRLLFYYRPRGLVPAVSFITSHWRRPHLNQSHICCELNNLHSFSVDCKVLLFDFRLKCLVIAAFISASHLFFHHWLKCLTGAALDDADCLSLLHLNQCHICDKLNNLHSLKADYKILLFHHRCKCLILIAFRDASDLCLLQLNQCHICYELKNMHSMEVDCQVLLFHRQLRRLGVSASVSVKLFNLLDFRPARGYNKLVWILSKELGFHRFDLQGVTEWFSQVFSPILNIFLMFWFQNLSRCSDRLEKYLQKVAFDDL